MRTVALVFCLPVFLFADAASRDAAFKQYCATCHSQAAKAGGFVLEGVPTADLTARPDVWEKAVRRIKAAEMPPAGAPRPDESAQQALIWEITGELDAAARRSPYAGKALVRRLNRVEYANAVRDLLAYDVPLANDLPQDSIAAGFDNIADALTMSPLLLERYLKVARRVAELATGTRESSPVTETYPATGTQAVWQEGMPFGTRGGIRVRHYFPHDGEYNLRAFLAKESLSPTEGVRFFRTTVKMKAGAHTVTVAFPNEFAAREGPVSDVGGPGGDALGGPLDLLGTAVRPTIEFRVDGRRVKLFEIAGMTAGEAAFDGQPGPPSLARIEIAGPYNAAGPGDTESRRRVFLCRPASARDEAPCAQRILSTIARRAFRRDVTAADLRPFLTTFTIARQKRDFEAAIGAAIRDILLAPDFLFRLEYPQPGKSLHPVSGFELASRLSFFLWNTIPDDALLNTAAKLADARTLESEVRRMLADPKSAALSENFAEQWLGLRGLSEVEPDKAVYPEFDSALTAAFQSETRLFVRSIMRENRSIRDLIGADYTFLNERLAKLYGVPGVTGPGFRRVSLAGNPHRGGLLTQGSMLLLTSHAGRTSPVLRGKWVLVNLLNSPPAAPPANVPPLAEGAVNGKKLTTRQKVEAHRNNPACAGCHARIDGLGFALENFDVIGRWRTADEGGEIDSSGRLANGKVYSGPQGLKDLLLNQSDGFVQGTVEKMLTYALGRELDARDQPTVREIMRVAEPGGYRFWDLVLAVVKSVPFQMRQAQEM